MSFNNTIPKPNTPWFDERTGLISRPWFLYLAQLGESVDEDPVFWAHLHT